MTELKANSGKFVRKIILGTFAVSFLIFIAAALYPHITGNYWVSADDIYKFEGVSGPDSVTTIAVPRPTRWQSYEDGSSSRLAILLTDENSSWLGVAHGLKSIGVPFRVTTSVDEALKHKVVLVYPIISGKVFTFEQIQKISEFARTAGSLIGINVLGGGLQSIFGFSSAESSREHHRLNLQGNHPTVRDLVDEGLKTIRLSSGKAGQQTFGSHTYLKPKHPPIALYNDGTPAIVYNKFSNGESYAIGFDIGHYLLSAYNNRLTNVADTYANAFEPSVDILLRLLKSIYQRHESGAVTLGTVPFNHSLSVILTHDIDYNESLKNALIYAKHEHDNNTSGTHFIQTKYIRDWNDEIFFDEESPEHINQLVASKVELASHSVSHSQVFNKFQIGTGDEHYPNYVPFVKDKFVAYNGSILGELRVSKFIIDYFSSAAGVVSFRPGHLSNPSALPQALEATGYKYSSSVAANTALTHLPFRLNYDREVTSEVSVFEFPITVEDELPPKMGDRLDDAIQLAHKIRRYGGLFVVLIHPNILDHKLDFQVGLVKAMKPYAWFGSMRQFGDWWSARDQVRIDVAGETDQTRVLLDVPSEINGLVVRVPETWRLLKTTPDSVQARQSSSAIVLDTAQGKVELHFAVRTCSDCNS